MTRQSSGEKQPEQAESSEQTVPEEAVDKRVHLHRHALESIFACLDIAGLAIVLAVSRDWQAAVGCMRSIGCEQRVSSHQLPQVTASRLRRHVASIVCMLDYTLDCTLTLNDISLLSERMPHLLRLLCSYITIPRGTTAISWPSQLQELMLETMVFPVAETNMLLQSIGTLTQLRLLQLELKYAASLSFAPLAFLPMLRVLRVEWARAVTPQLSWAQVDEFRALRDLEQFEVRMDAESMARLLRLPHTLRWQSAPGLRAGDDAECALLLSLSCVTTLDMRFAFCSHFDWLPRMQSLTELFVGLSVDHPSASAATQSLMAALQHCPRITSLTVDAWGMPITAELLSTSLRALPALSTLHLYNVSLPSLSFLAVPTLALSLRDLQLQLLHFRAPQPDVSEVRHLHRLRSLRHLRLRDVFATPLDADTRALLEPPSQLLPLLETFDYSHA